MDEQRPRDVAHLWPQRDKHGLAITPGGYLSAPRIGGRSPAGNDVPSPPSDRRRQPAGELVITIEHGPAHQPLGDLACRVDHERGIRFGADPVHPALAARAMMDARGAERRPDGQRGDGMACLVPGGPDGRLPGRPVRRVAAAVVALPDPPVVDDRLVVVPDQAGQLGLDLR